MDLKWVKLAVGLFDNRKIRAIEHMPEGDTILVIWIKLLCMAGAINDGGRIYLTPEIPYTEETLAAYLGRPAAVVRLAVRTFTAFGMLECGEEGTMRLTGWEKYQSAERLEEIREQNRLRKQAQRRRELQAGAQATEAVSRDSHVTAHASVTRGHAAEAEKEPKEKKETEKEEEKEAAVLEGEEKRARTREKPLLYGHYQNVSLSAAEYQGLQAALGSYLSYYIERLSGYMASKKASIANHEATLRLWFAEDSAKGRLPERSKSRGEPSYDIEAFAHQGFDLPGI